MHSGTASPQTANWPLAAVQNLLIRYSRMRLRGADRFFTFYRPPAIKGRYIALHTGKNLK